MTAPRTAAVSTLSDQLTRHRSRALRLLDSAQDAMRRGRWNEAEDLLWGSLVSAARGVALWHGQPTDDTAQLRQFLHRLGEQERDRHLRDAFDHLSAFADAAARVRERRSRVDYLFIAMDDLSESIERLTAHIPGDDAPPPDADV